MKKPESSHTSHGKARMPYIFSTCILRCTNIILRMNAPLSPFTYALLIISKTLGARPRLTQRQREREKGGGGKQENIPARNIPSSQEKLLDNLTSPKSGITHKYTPDDPICVTNALHPRVKKPLSSADSILTTSTTTYSYRFPTSSRWHTG